MKTTNLSDYIENPDNPYKATAEELARLKGKLERVPKGLKAMRLAYVTDFTARDGAHRARQFPAFRARAFRLAARRDRGNVALAASIDRGFRRRAKPGGLRMEVKGKAHCFFEQSGTFKRAFAEFGIPAEDYDIQNNFGETDHVIDLFAEIERAYEGGGVRV